MKIDLSELTPEICLVREGIPVISWYHEYVLINEMILDTDWQVIIVIILQVTKERTVMITSCHLVSGKLVHRFVNYIWNYNK